MKLIIKAAVSIVIVVLIVASAYIIFFTDTDENKDNEPPTIDTITGDTTGTMGKITTIYVTFSDNIGVTEAILHYKTASEESWHSTSIINGSANIVIPSDFKENWLYYVTADDAANNGPIGDPSTDGSSYYTITVSFENIDLTHYVFIEEGTVTWCEDCPVIRDIIHELFESEEYNFYYVSMVLDKNDKAKERLKNDYNIVGYPTLFIDGGYSVILEGSDDVSIYTQAIQQAAVRDVFNVQVTINAEYDKNTNELKTEAVVYNYENETYISRLRVYLTEINSRWINSYSEEPKPYHYGFIDYIINEDITVDSDDITTITATKKLTDFLITDLDPENLMVIAVVFNSESVEKYAYPPNENPFNAYFADNADAAKVVEGGNLPPTVAICNPNVGKLHILGRPIVKTLRRNTILIGKTKIDLCIEDDSGIEKVEFYIDGNKIFTDEEAPYEYTLKRVKLFRRFVRKHTIMVKAYDDTGKIATDSIDVITFIL